MTYEELLENYSEARRGVTKTKRNLIRIYRGLMVEIDARVNNETMDRYGIERPEIQELIQAKQERQAKRLEEE